MTDVFSAEKRRQIMASIRSKNTKPELRVKKLLRRLGISYRSNSRLPGRPDVVLPKNKTAVFIHGCFWHRHPGCPRASTPSSNKAFWRHKFEANVLRDNKCRRELRHLGWRTMVIWECQLSDDGRVAKRLLR